MEYYVFQTRQQADGCLTAINSNPVFPVRGTFRGKPAPEGKCKTERWCDAPVEMLSGEWAVPRIPQERLDHLGIGEDVRGPFLAAYGNDIRELSPEDFPQPEELT
jgi:hypothetical protein